MRLVGMGRLRRSTVLLGAGALAVGLVGALAPLLGTAGATTRSSAPLLQSINVAKYPGVLGNSKQHSLYLLSDEMGAKIHCKGSCLQYWIPLTVAKGTMLKVGAGVKGKWATVARMTSKATEYQVTYNSFPVYTYVADTGAKQSHGEGVKFSSGVWWYLIKASATSAAGTPVTKPSGSSGGGGGGGW